MNSFRSYKLKLPKNDTSVPQGRYDSDSLLSSSSVSSDNDDYAECHQGFFAQNRAQSDMTSPIAPMTTKSIPRSSSFFPMNAFQAAERIAETFGRSGYSFNFGTNAHNQSITRMPGLIFSPPFNYGGRSSFFSSQYMPKENGDRAEPVGRKNDNRDSITPKNNISSIPDGRLKIDGVSFTAKNEPKSPDSMCEENQCVKKVKPKAMRKKASPRFHHVGCAKSRGCFRCRYCARRFSYICHMKVHERVHTGEKPYSCEFCSHQFSQLGSLTVHMRIHTGAKPYQCGECWKKFRHVNSLRRHQRQVHNMTSEQIARSIDKVKDAVLLEKQLGVINQSVRSPPPSGPFNFRSALQYLPLQWYGSNGIWNNTYKNMFVFGQNNEYSNESLETVDSDSDITPVTPTDKSKPIKTWRPFEEGTDDENEEDISNHISAEKCMKNSLGANANRPTNFTFTKTDEAIVGPSATQHDDCNKNDRGSVKNIRYGMKKTASTAMKSNSDTEGKEQMSDGYVSMDEVSSCSSIEHSSAGKRYKSHNQCNLAY